MKQKLPEGWSQERIQAVIEHYENQTEDEAVAEDEAAYHDPSSAMVQIPRDLLPEVGRLLADYEAKKQKKARRK